MAIPPGYAGLGWAVGGQEIYRKQKTKMISASPHLRSLRSQSTAFIILRGKLQKRQSKGLVWIRSLFLGKPCLERWVQASHWHAALILQKMALKCAWHPFSSHQTRKSKRRWPHGWIPFGQANERSNLYAVSMHSSQIGKEVRKWSLEGPGNRGRQATGAIVLAHHVSPKSAGWILSLRSNQPSPVTLQPNGAEAATWNIPQFRQTKETRPRGWKRGRRITDSFPGSKCLLMA